MNEYGGNLTCVKVEDWNHLPWEVASRKLSEFWRWLCKAEFDRGICLLITLILFDNPIDSTTQYLQFFNTLELHREAVTEGVAVYLLNACQFYFILLCENKYRCVYKRKENDFETSKGKALSFTNAGQRGSTERRVFWRCTLSLYL